VSARAGRWVRRSIAAAASALAGMLAAWASGCATLPCDAAQRALYVDLRTAVDASEDDGWTVDWVRLQANAEPALRSACQVTPRTRAALDRWLDASIQREGGPAERIYHAHGDRIGPASEVLSLERTRALLQFASAHAPHDCPFYLQPKADFEGVQGDAGRWLLLAETHGFVTFVIDTRVPALGGGGRLLLGHGIGSRWSLAAGAELGAAGSFIPSKQGGVDATATLAGPLLLRLTSFSHLYDVELAPVVRFAHGTRALPPGARIELGFGFASLRSSAFMSYFMLYAGYEFHPHVQDSPADHTLQAGTRLAVYLGL
jgi:hypothetical protein